MTDLPLHRPITSTDLIAQALGRDRGRPAVIGVDGAVLTAGALADAISRYQQALEALAPRPARIAVLARNRVEVLHATNAASFADMVVTALHPLGAVDDYLHILTDAAIDTLIFDQDHYGGVAAALAERAPTLVHVLALGPGVTGVDLAALAAPYAPRGLTAPAVDETALFRIAYSGGTTGRPKGIMVSHRSAFASALIQLTDWEWPAAIRHLICAPLSHSGSAVLTSVLARDGVLVVVPGFEPVAVMQAIEQHRITSVLMVPTMVIALLDHPRFGEFNLTSLEVVFYGAAAFPPRRLQEAIAKLGPIFFQFYGQAEAPMSVTVMRRAEHLFDDLGRLASCGRPSTLAHVALLDDAGCEVAPGTPGEICVRGPLVMTGYLNQPEETARAFAGGWLHTGDVAVRDADGFLRIVDRKKDMIVTGGFNVYAREVEDVLVEQPGVRQAAVIGVPDEKWGETVLAVVVGDPGALPAAASLIASVRARKGAVQAPKAVVFVDALPLSPLGKPDKKVLRLRYAGMATM